MKKLLKSLIFITSVPLMYSSQATFDKPVIDEEHQESQLFTKNISNDIKEVSVNNQFEISSFNFAQEKLFFEHKIKELKLFFHNFERYDFQCYMFNKEFIKLKEEEGLVNKNISLSKSEILKAVL
ncbi:MAG: hypothetical protein ACRYGR_08990 [Janthinobacterium lividum]